MSINIHTTITNAQQVKLVKTGDDEITIWVHHDYGQVTGIWLEEVASDLELILDGVQEGRQPQPKKKGHGFSNSTMEKAVTLLRQGSFTRRQIGSFIGLTDNSVSTLLSDLGKDFTLIKIGKINKLYSIAS